MFDELVNERYKVEKPLGKGAFSLVYEAKDTWASNAKGNDGMVQVAVKIMEGDCKEMGKNEAKILNGLGAGESIVKFLGNFDFNGRFYLVLEKGRSLLPYCSDGERLNVDEVRYVTHRWS